MGRVGRGIRKSRRLQGGWIKNAAVGSGNASAGFENAAVGSGNASAGFKNAAVGSGNVAAGFENAVVVLPKLRDSASRGGRCKTHVL